MITNTQLSNYWIIAQYTVLTKSGEIRSIFLSCLCETHWQKEQVYQGIIYFRAGKVWFGTKPSELAFAVHPKLCCSGLDNTAWHLELYEQKPSKLLLLSSLNDVDGAQKPTKKPANNNNNKRKCIYYPCKEKYIQHRHYSHHLTSQRTRSHSVQGVSHLSMSYSP